MNDYLGSMKCYDFPLTKTMKEAFGLGGDLTRLVEPQKNSEALNGPNSVAFVIHHDIAMHVTDDNSKTDWDWIRIGGLEGGVDEKLAYVYIFGRLDGTPYVYSGMPTYKKLRENDAEDWKTGLSQQAASAGVSAVVVGEVVATAAGRGAAAGGMSAKAVALAEAGLKGMAVARGKIGMALVLAAGVLVAGVGVLVRPVPAAKQPAALPAAGLEQPPPRAAPRARAGREGDALPEGAIARLGDADSSGDVVCVAVAPDGKVMATAG